MNLLMRLLLILFLVSCSGDDESDNVLYSFPALSLGQLVDLKKRSESIEGFFITTDLSDLDSSWEERGFYLYVCIRFLNDEEVNKKINRSAIPLLVQVSTHKDKPTAESVVLLHPNTVRDGKGTFYYEERKHFQLAESPITVRNIEYNIFDVLFNEKGKITNVSFLKNGITLEDLKNVEDDDEVEDNEDPENNVGGSESDEEEAAEDDDADEEDDDWAVEDDDDQEEEITIKKKDVILEVKAFAKQTTSSCANWPILNYKHSLEIPDYLKVNYGTGQSAGNPADGTGTGSSTGISANSGRRSVALIPESAPHVPVPQIEPQ